MKQQSIARSTPADWGMPERFRDWEWRPNQEEAVEEIIGAGAEQSDREFVCRNMPTGTGKTLISVTAGMHAQQVWSRSGVNPQTGEDYAIPGRACILTMTKSLQDQVVKDYPDCEIFDLRGRSNHTCTEYADSNCEFGYEHGCRQGLDSCPYQQAVQTAAKSPLVVTNYACWSRQRNRDGVSRLGKFNLVICDEAHDIEDAVVNAMEVVVFANEYPNQPRGADALDAGEWYAWAEQTIQSYLNILAVAEEEYKTYKSQQALKNLRKMRKKVDKLNIILRDVDGGWAVDHSTIDGVSQWQMRPVWAVDYADRAIYSHADRVALISGSLTRKAVELSGVPQDALSSYLCYPSQFDPARNPLIHVPTLQMNYNTVREMTSTWVAQIDRLIEQRLDRKGIVHAISYDIMKAIRTYSRFRNQMIWHNNSHDQKAALDRFRRAGPGTVLISPSATTGLDFPDNLCRYQIIVKIPYPPTTSAVMKRRHEEDKEYCQHVMCQKIVQICGRGMRSEDDWCENLIIDDRIKWVMSKMEHLFPEWFPAHFQWAQGRGLPEPMEME